MSALSTGSGIRKLWSGTIIRTHVNPARHMALYAHGAAADFKQDFAFCRPDRLPRFTFLFMKMVLFGIVLGGPVTLQAQFITFLDQLDGVHIMAVAATHIVTVHFALGK